MSSQHDTTKQRRVLFLNFDSIVANRRARVAYGYHDDPPVYADTTMIECLKRAIYRRPIQMVIITDPQIMRVRPKHKEEIFTLLGDLGKHVHRDWSVQDHGPETLKNWLQRHPNMVSCAIVDEDNVYDKDIRREIPQMKFFPGNSDGLTAGAMEALLDWSRIPVMKRAEKEAAPRKTGERPHAREY